jgi:hypothetical protein
MNEQLLHVPVTALPPGLTTLQSVHIQFHLESDRHAAAPPPQQATPLAAVFADLQDLDYTHGDHGAADRLLEAALPHCARLRQLHVSGPGAFYHTPLPAALEYGVRYGLEASTLFTVPFSTWLPALFGRSVSVGGAGGGTWLRHLAGLEALTELHLDLPLLLPAQVRELVDALVARGALHSLALHGVAISLVTRRDWVVAQLARLAAIHLQNINISFGRHVLAALPSWMRGGGGGGAHGHGGGGGRRGDGAAPQPDPRDMRMLERLAEVFSATPEAHFVMHDHHGLEESIHTQPWGLPAPPGGQHGGDAFGAAGGADAHPGPVAEGVEQQPPQQQQQQQQQAAAPQPAGDQQGPGDFQFPLPVRLLAHVLAVMLGPRAAVNRMAAALAPIMGAHDLPAHWQLTNLLMEVLAPHHDPEQVAFPMGVAGCNWAAAAFAAGAVLPVCGVAVAAAALLRRLDG